MAEMQTDAAALSAASVEIDGIRSFFLFEDSDPESPAGMQDTEKGVAGMFASTPVEDGGTRGAGMQQTEQGVTGMFASAGDTGGEAVQKLSGIWGGSGSDAYLQTQSRWDSTAADLNSALKDLGHADQQIQELNTISENINRSGTQYQQAADDAASSLASSMGFTPPDDGFDFKAADAGEAASDSLKYNFAGIEGAASAVQPDTGDGWLLGL